MIFGSVMFILEPMHLQNQVYAVAMLCVLIVKCSLDKIFIFPRSPSQLKTDFLPLLSVIFVSENSLVAAVSIAQSPRRAYSVLVGILNK